MSHLVSEAVCAYLHWRTSPYPEADIEAVRALAATPGEAHALVASVEAVIRASEEIPFTDEQFRQSDRGDEMRALLAERCPELDDEALRAVASRLAYHRFR